VLLAFDLHEDFIDEESIAIAPVLALQPVCTDSSELDTPEMNSFPGDIDALISQQVLVSR